MRIDFANDTIFNDYYEWIMQDKKVAKKIMSLIKDISRSPYEGIGHPEPLKYELSGYWSRAITEEHRMVYSAITDVIERTRVTTSYQYDTHGRRTVTQQAGRKPCRFI